MSQTQTTETVEETTSLPTHTTQNGHVPKKPPKKLAPSERSDDAAAAPTLEREVVTENDRPLEATEPPKPPAMVAAQKKDKAATSELSVALRKLKNDTELEAYQWINAIAGEGAIQIVVVRREPKTITDPRTGQKVKTDGTVGTYDRTITESELAEMHGGGTYLLRVQTKNGLGRWEYFGAKTVDIAGDPRIDDVPRNNAPQAQGPTIVQAPADPAAGKALDMMVGLMGKQLEHANRPVPNHGPSAADIAAMIQQATLPLQNQITQLLQQLADKDKALVEARQAPPDAFRDLMLKTLMEGESARITAIKTQYDSEIRQLKDHAIENEKRLRDGFERDIKRIEDQHKRELDSIKGSHQTAIDMAKHAGELNKTVLEAENKRLSTEVIELRAEVKELRNIKNPSIKEKVDELNAIKELLGNDEDGEEGGIGDTIAKVVEVAGNLPAFNKLVDKFGGPPEQAAAQQQQARAPRQRRLVRNAAGEVFQPTPQGMIPLKPKNQQVVVGDKTVEIPPLDPDNVKTAILFMEGAFRSNTDPQTFAQGARPHVGPSILQAIRVLGISEFLSKVAKIDGGSVLATQSGRNWCKKVAHALLQMEEESDAQPAPQAPSEPPADGGEA